MHAPQAGSQQFTGQGGGLLFWAGSQALSGIGPSFATKAWSKSQFFESNKKEDHSFPHKSHLNHHLVFFSITIVGLSKGYLSFYDPTLFLLHLPLGYLCVRNCTANLVSKAIQLTWQDGVPRC